MIIQSNRAKNHCWLTLKAFAIDSRKLRVGESAKHFLLGCSQTRSCEAVSFDHEHVRPAAHHIFFSQKGICRGGIVGFATS